MARYKFFLSLCMILIAYPCLVSATITLRDIQVSAQAQSGLEARDQALREARRQAYQKLAHSPEGRGYGLSINQMLQDDILETLVDTFEVENEKIATQHYAGTFSITFNVAGLRAAAHNRAALATDTPNNSDNVSAFASPGEETLPHNKPGKNPPSSFIVVPIYITPDEALLWQAENPLRTYLESFLTTASKMMIPLGDLEDIHAVSIEDFMAGKVQKVRHLVERYRQDKALVIFLKQMDYEGKIHEMRVQIFDKNQHQTLIENLQIDADDRNQSFKAAVDRVLSALEQGQSNDPQSNPDNQPGRTLQTTVAFQGFDEWQKIKLVLDSHPDILKFDVKSLSLKQARITIYIRKSFQDLVGELAQKGLRLLEATPDTFELTLMNAGSLTPTKNTLSPFEQN